MSFWDKALLGSGIFLIAVCLVAVAILAIIAVGIAQEAIG
jgi:hypothetical protein